MTAGPHGSATGRGNCFDLVRLGAAAAVVVNHCLVLNGNHGIVVFTWNDRALDLGACAVATFFVVSGYLIAGSWIAEPDLVAFVTKRVLRVYPGLVVVVLLSVFVLGPSVTALPFGAYASRGTTWNYLGTVTLAPVRTNLPGVFSANPVPYVNGSLWTLPVEILCYGLLATLAFFGAARRRWPLLVTASVLFVRDAGVFGSTGVDMRFGGLLTFFFLGAVLRVYTVRLSAVGAAMAIGSVLLSLWTGVFAVGAFGLAYLIVFAGSRKTRIGAAFSRRGDPTYGIYIYAYPIQQTLVLAGLTTMGSLLAASLPLAVLAGYCSWHFVEKPVMTAGRASLRRYRKSLEEPRRITVPDVAGGRVALKGEPA